MIARAVAMVLILCTTSCATSDYRVPPMAQDRTISEQDCRTAFSFDGGNLRCR